MEEGAGVGNDLRAELQIPYKPLEIEQQTGMAAKPFKKDTAQVQQFVSRETGFYGHGVKVKAKEFDLRSRAEGLLILKA